MDFTLNEAEKSVGTLSERILTDLVTDESLRALELGDTWMHSAAWEALAQSELLGLALPELHGGSDLGLIALCQLLRKVGRATAPLPVLPTLVMGALPIARFGTEAQRHKYLSGVATGRIQLTAALEQHGSRDLERPTVVARPTDAGLALDGTCVQVPGLPDAAFMLVPAVEARAGARERSDAEKERFDPTALSSVFRDPARQLAFLRKFVISAQTTLAEIHSAWDRRAHEEIGFAGHKLKSSAKACGAHALADLCAELERRAKDPEWAQLDALRGEAERLLDEVARRVSAMEAAAGASGR